MKTDIKKYRREYYKKYFQKERLRILKVLGGSCSSELCTVPMGETNPVCLNIVYVLSSRNKPKTMYSMYKDIDKNPDFYRLLCHNCKSKEGERSKKEQNVEQVKPAGKVAPKEPLERDVKEEDEEYVEQDEEWVDEEFTLDLDIVVENLLDNYLAGDSKGVGKKLDEFVVDGQIKAGQKAEVMKRLKRKKAKLV